MHVRLRAHIHVQSFTYLPDGFCIAPDTISYAKVSGADSIAWRTQLHLTPASYTGHPNQSTWLWPFSKPRLRLQIRLRLAWPRSCFDNLCVLYVTCSELKGRKRSLKLNPKPKPWIRKWPMMSLFSLVSWQPDVGLHLKLETCEPYLR